MTVNEVVWLGSADRDELNPEIVAKRDALADASRAGTWREVFALLDRDPDLVNAWRIGGASWFAPLHQAAWHGAPVDVVAELLERGAWRTLPAANGQTPQQIAVEHGHDATAELLVAGLREDRLSLHRRLDAELNALIDRRIRPQIRSELRFPVTAVLTEVGDVPMWFPVPGMYGGFSIRLMRSYLFVESWSRMVGGSGQAHVITAEGTTLVEEGFV